MQGLDTQDLRVAEAERRKSLPVVLVTVTRTWDSSPRPPGSLMAINGGGGTISHVATRASPLTCPRKKEMSKFGAKSTTEDVLAGISLKGKRFLVTGASSGIGRETARALVAHGAGVVGAAKHAAKALEATAQIREAAAKGGGDWQLIDLDLSSQANVRAAAQRLLKDGQRFDAIIANAGVMAPPLGRTADGFELQFGINHLGHFAFVNAVEPLLLDGGRLVVLSSQAHRGADVDLVDPNFDNRPYDAWQAYSQSKTANALFAVEFDRRHRTRGVRAASVMPGNALTNLPQHLSPQTLQGLFDTVGNARAEAGLPPPELKEIPQAAATSVWAAVVADKDVIGGRYLEDCAVAPVVDMSNPFADGVRSYALDGDKARQLWARSEELLRAAA
jgi:NAD(P)-dependent dehydrogenase (short-subunit alcohol dehydrogenase family)